MDLCLKKSVVTGRSSGYMFSIELALLVCNRFDMFEVESAQSVHILADATDLCRIESEATPASTSSWIRICTPMSRMHLTKLAQFYNRTRLLSWRSSDLEGRALCLSRHFCAAYSNGSETRGLQGPSCVIE